jgi:hypothetical protein
MNTKSIDAETVRLENRLEDLRQEVDKNVKAREAIIAEISKKTDDFNSYMAIKDSELKKSNTELLVQRDELNNQKSEFQTILKQHQESKASLDKEKHEFEIQKLRTVATTQNVQEFITAVRRACSLLGI